ncbi:MAG: MBL fold metallo-hydrolase RNA specificity domain-containing protein [Candidatus Micrarchaeia archaeon]
MEISFFGGQQEVGRSCIMVASSNGSTKILLDAGVMLGETELYPVFDDSLLKEIDGIFISHPHLDHCGYLPHIFTAGYLGKVYATKPTKELADVLISDYMRISNPKNVTKEGLKALSKSYLVIEYGKDIKIKDLTIRFEPAGHTIGSAYIVVKEGDKTLVYTGDINLARTKLLEPAKFENINAQVLITESTYGGRNDIFPPQRTTVSNMLKDIKEIIKANGKVIIPSFAVGRAQEVLLILDDYMNSGVIPKVPIYIDGMIKKALRIHRYNVIYCRKELQMKILMSDYDPFKSSNFIEINGKQMRNKIINSQEAAIIVTTSGMLTGGPALSYLSKMAQNPLNALFFVGYQAEGTLGREILNGAKEIKIDNKTVEIKLLVKNYHLSAHADRRQLEQLLKKIKGLEKVFIVHGEYEKSMQFRDDISSKYEAFVPKVGDSYRL